jgi:aminomethyltransferase
VVSFSIYNHMYMPTGFGDPMAEYDRLLNGVAMWDVAVERQVELAGPDAGRLAQALCPRKLAKMKPGQGWYVPICDHQGILLNDPILLKLAEDRYWLSIADGDLRLWASAVAAERKLDVAVTEPDVSPLAIQGPKAMDVVASLFDDSIRSMGYFRFREVDLDGIPLVLQRSGWSKQGGFELYLRDGSRGTELWNKVKEAGAPFGIGPGCPNGMERVESGLLSYGGDTDDQTNPFEVRMGKSIDLDAPDDTIGIKALRRIHERGPQRHQLGVALDHEQAIPGLDLRSKVFKGATMAGHMTANAWSPRLQMNLGLCLVWTGLNPGDTVQVELPDGRRIEGEMRELPVL